MNSKFTFSAMMLTIILMLSLNTANAEGRKSPQRSIASLSKGVRFQNLSFHDAQKQAEYRKQPIFVYIGSQTCMQSQRMLDVFKMKDVSLFLNQNFYNNKYNTESILSVFRANASWSVQHYPTYLFFTKGGKLIARSEGYQSQAKFLEIAKKALADIYDFEVSQGLRKADELGSPAPPVLAEENDATQKEVKTASVEPTSQSQKAKEAKELENLPEAEDISSHPATKVQEVAPTPAPAPVAQEVAPITIPAPVVSSEVPTPAPTSTEQTNSSSNNDVQLSLPNNQNNAATTSEPISTPTPAGETTPAK